MRHAAIVPLAGGAVIGAALSLKRDPEYMASWEAFAKNDAYARAYFKNVPFHIIPDLKTIPKIKVPKVDIITCVPPCSGLSTATPSTARGCQAPQNEHMLRVAEFGMVQSTKVIIIENAPGLYSKGGEEFALRFVPLCKKYGYRLRLLKTSTILHGLPQNRVRSFAILYRGNKVPVFNWIKIPYSPLNLFPVRDSEPYSKWVPKNDEVIQVLSKHLEVTKAWTLLDQIHTQYNGEPVSGWKVLKDYGIKHKFKTKPYKYMQSQQAAGEGIMDRSPYLVTDHTNALMWKSVNKMMNPNSPSRPFNIRELMDLMGLPKDYKEFPAKQINILFQNVPVTTVRTLVDEVKASLEGKRKWYDPGVDIQRVNNIKQTYEL